MTLLLFSPLIDLGPVSALAQRPLGEPEAKAIFVRSLIKLSEWPAEAFATNTSPFVVGVLGRNPFGEWSGVISTNKIRDREVQVHEFSSVEEARKQAHLLFINPADKNTVPALLAQLQGANVLTLSDMDGFVQKGGMVGLAFERKRIIYRVNRRALTGSKVVLPSQVLKLASEILE